MLSRLLEVTAQTDQFNLEETRVRASNLLCKVTPSPTVTVSLSKGFINFFLGVPAAPAVSLLSPTLPRPVVWNFGFHGEIPVP